MQEDFVLLAIGHVDDDRCSFVKCIKAFLRQLNVRYKTHSQKIHDGLCSHQLIQSANLAYYTRSEQKNLKKRNKKPQQIHRKVCEDADVKRAKISNDLQCRNSNKISHQWPSFQYRAPIPVSHSSKKSTIISLTAIYQSFPLAANQCALI